MARIPDFVAFSRALGFEFKCPRFLDTKSLDRFSRSQQ